MRKNIYIVFPDYDVKIHGTKDVGVIYTLLKQSHNVKMICCHPQPADPDCIALPGNEIDAGAWLQAEPAAVLILLHFSQRRGKLIEKAKEYGYKIIIKGDSDGFEVQTVWNPFSPEFLRQMKFGSRHFTLIKYWLRLITLKRWARKNGFYDVDHIMLETSKAYRLFVKALPDLMDKFFMLPSGVFFGENDLLPPKENIVIAAGRWDDHPQKNPELLLAAIAKAAALYPEWKFIIAGPYDDKVLNRYNQLAAAVKTRVDLHGSCTHTEVLNYMRRSKILLNTSRWESFGLVGVEALSQGCSLVCTPTCMAMQTADGLLGTKADGWRVADVAQALTIEIRMWAMNMRDPERIIAAARAFYDWRMIIAKLESIIEH